ncbi:MAG: amidohydrolase family protein [Bacteroidota bacterium]
MKSIDVHCYYGKWGFPIWDMSIKDIQEYMHACEIEASIMMSALSISYDFVAGNAEIAELVDSNPNLYGYVYVNMHYPEESVKEVKKYLGSDKFLGIKYNGEYSQSPVSADSNDIIFELVEKEYGKPLLLHTWGVPEHGNAMAYSLPSQALKLARKFPKMDIVMGHMGGPSWMSAIEAAMQEENLFLDTCSSYVDRDKVRVAVDMLGADRIMFGSGMTENNPFGQKRVIMDAEISESDKKKILYENACSVFKI